LVGRSDNMVEAYNVQTTLQLVLEKSSLKSAVDNISKDFNKIFEKMKVKDSLYGEPSLLSKAGSKVKEGAGWASRLGKPEGLYGPAMKNGNLFEGMGDDDEDEGGGGGLKEMAGSLSSLVSMTTIISGAMLIVGGFFEAVGPFLKVLVKVIGAFFLILLAPVFRALAPYMPALIKTFMNFGRWLSGGLVQLMKWIGDFIKDPLGSLKKLHNWFWSLIADAVQWGVKNLPNLIAVALEAILKIGGDIGGGIVTDVKTTFKNLLLDSFMLGFRGTNDFLGNPVDAETMKVYEEVSKNLLRKLDKLLLGGFFTGSGTAGDFISRPGMGIQSFSPNDTIVGMKDLGGLGGGGVNITNNFKIDASVDKTEMKRILSQFSRDQAREVRNKVSYVGGLYS